MKGRLSDCVNPQNEPCYGLTRFREQFQEIPHRNRYWKNNPRKSYA